MTDRVPCKSPGCSRTILPATAERTGGYCVPCVQAAAQRKHEEYVSRNRRDFNPYRGLEDPVEILKIVHQPRKSDPLLRVLPCPEKTEALYARLDAPQTAALIQHAAALLKSGADDAAEDIARCLTAFTEADVSSLLHAFVRLDQVHSASIFLRAPPDIRDLLIERLARVPGSGDGRNIRNRLLCALAWIGDDRVVDLFAQWRRRPPPWAATLFIPPDRYAEVAGWQLSADFQRRELYHRLCYPLVPAATEEVFADAVAVITARAESCPRCSHALTNLFELEGNSGPLAFLSHESDRLCVPTCERCLDLLIGKLSDRARTWAPWNEGAAYAPIAGPDGESLPQRQLSMARTPRSPWHAADDSLPTAFSQIGGHPTWIQDATYPACPECRQTMMFIGQVACEDLDPHREGIHYAFLCSGCRTTASCYQQT